MNQDYLAPKPSFFLQHLGAEVQDTTERKTKREREKEREREGETQREETVLLKNDITTEGKKSITKGAKFSEQS